MSAPALPAAAPCAACGTQLSPRLLACPACGALVHRAALERLAAEAQAAEGAGDPPRAMAHWRDALDLLPAGAPQRAVIEGRLETLGREADRLPMARAARAEGPWWKRSWGVLAAGGIFLLTKGKLLLLGLTKVKTVFSMLAFFGVYWSMFGWVWALGLVLCIYVHEMGHVAWLARYGVKATAPMFIPGIGAFITMKQPLADARQEARVGLAGPLWGLGAGLVALGLARALDNALIGAVAHTAAWLNLFNMVPVWQLDGAHAFRALVQWQRVAAGVALVALWWLTGVGVAGIVGAVAIGVGLFTRATARTPDHGALAMYAGIAAALAWLGTTGAPIRAAGGAP